MSSRQLRDQFIERRIVLGRVVAALIIVTLAAGGLFARLGFLQVSNYAHYNTLSRENRINLVPIPPNRGLIYDRSGTVLAENIPTFSLDII
ncbi:MAG: penicillin-binding protein 2, partial [Pseudomonadota bacterium]